MAKIVFWDMARMQDCRILKRAAVRERLNIVSAAGILISVNFANVNHAGERAKRNNDLPY